MTFAPPLAELIGRDHRWLRPGPASGGTTGQQLPPPPPGATPTPGPAPWTRFGDLDHLDADHLDAGHLDTDRFGVVVGREFADSFELIWPTGEIDEQFLGGPLSEMPAPGEPYLDAPRSRDLDPPPLPMTVRLRPLVGPSEVAEPSWAEPVSNDVVRAIQRAIASIGSELTVVDEPPTAPRSSGGSTESVVDAPGISSAEATGGDGIAMGPASDENDARRSALKRLIGGLRRR